MNKKIIHILFLCVHVDVFMSLHYRSFRNRQMQDMKKASILMTVGLCEVPGVMNLILIYAW